MKNLKLLRIEQGLTQQGLARRMGTIQAMISNIERGAVRPTPDMILRLSKVLDIDPGILTVCEGKITFDDKK